MERWSQGQKKKTETGRSWDKRRGKGKQKISKENGDMILGK